MAGKPRTMRLMRLLLLSDLHLEFHPFTPPPFAPHEAPDVVVLAGDIANGATGITWARQTFERMEILYVPGNHEYYEGALDEVEAAMAQAGRVHGVHVLQNEAVTLGVVRFLGATLWTDFRLWGEARAVADAGRCERVLMDYHLIGQPGRPFAGDADSAQQWAVDTPVGRFSGRAPAHPLRAADTLALHEASRAWLAAQLAPPANPDPLRTVVITHHFPSVRSCAARFMNDAVSAGFGSDLEGMMGHCGAWLHGHTHDSCTYGVAGRGPVTTRVVCNPRGYPLRSGQLENPYFRADLQVVLTDDGWVPTFEAPRR